MKVVHVVPYYQEGLGYEENHLGFAQRRRGARVTLITSTRPLAAFTGSSGNNLEDLSSDHPVAPLRQGHYEDQGVAIVRLVPKLEVRGHMQLMMSHLAASIQNESPDILQLHSPVGILTVQTLRIAQKLRLPVVTDSHINYYNLAPYGLMKRLYYATFKKLILPHYSKTIKRYLPHSPDASKLLRCELGIPSQALTQITLGTDTSTFKFDPTIRKKVRSKFGLPSDSHVLIVVGRITPEKDLDVLMKACSRLWTELNIYLILAGPVEDSYKQRLIELIPSGSKHRVSFHGFIPNETLPEYFSIGDVAIWPGDPAISIIEALACELPVIVSKSESSRHLVSNCNGRVFQRGDSSSLTETIRDLLSDQPKLRKMGRRSRDLARRVFDWDNVADRYLTVYREILTGQELELDPIWKEGQI